jgi:hypothetical protein
MGSKIYDDFKPFIGEIFKEVDFGAKLKYRYAISNYGRFIKYTDKVEEGKMLTGGLTDGYRIFRYRIKENGVAVDKYEFVYKLVAKYFLKKTSPEQTCVIHLDYCRNNDAVLNLKYATKPEMLAHIKRSPAVIEAKKRLVEFNKQSDGRKLTVTQVIHLKKRLLDPNRKTKLKSLAKQFNISEMQLYRIKRGDNWAHLKVDLDTKEEK